MTRGVRSARRRLPAAVACGLGAVVPCLAMNALAQRAPTVPPPSQSGAAPGAPSSVPLPAPIPYPYAGGAPYLYVVESALVAGLVTAYGEAASDAGASFDWGSAWNAWTNSGAAATSVPASGPGAAYFNQGAAVTSVPTSGPVAAYFRQGAELTSPPSAPPVDAGASPAAPQAGPPAEILDAGVELADGAGSEQVAAPEGVEAGGAEDAALPAAEGAGARAPSDASAGLAVPGGPPAQPGATPSPGAAPPAPPGGAAHTLTLRTEAWVAALGGIIAVAFVAGTTLGRRLALRRPSDRSPRGTRA